MYIPEKMKMTDVTAMQQFIEEFSFGIIVSNTDKNKLNATHLPFTLNKEDGEFGSLTCHFARVNPHWRQLNEQELLVIFNGPHSFISSKWYAKQPNVPTWNYAAVHCQVKAEVLPDAEADVAMQKTLTMFEPSLLNKTEHNFQHYQAKLMKAIVFVKLTITGIEGKLKLGQHRNNADQQSVTNALASESTYDAMHLLSYMKKINCGLGNNEA